MAITNGHNPDITKNVVNILNDSGTILYHKLHNRFYQDNSVDDNGKIFWDIIIFDYKKDIHYAAVHSRHWLNNYRYRCGWRPLGITTLISTSGFLLQNNKIIYNESIISITKNSAVFYWSSMGKSVLTTKIEGAEWFTGGQFGLEGSIQATVFCLVATMVLILIDYKQHNIIKPYRQTKELILKKSYHFITR